MYAELYRLVANRGRNSQIRNDADADDIIQWVVEKLIDRFVFFSSRYPDPVKFARAALGTTTIDFYRRQNSQRGSGARGTRTVVSGNHVGQDDDGVSPFDLVAAEGSDFADDLVSQMDAAYESVEIQLGLPRDEFEALWLTEVEGLTDAEAAKILGVARECVNRRKNKAIKKLRGGAA